MVQLLPQFFHCVQIFTGWCLRHAKRQSASPCRHSDLWRAFWDDVHCCATRLRLISWGVGLWHQNQLLSPMMTQTWKVSVLWKHLCKYLVMVRWHCSCWSLSTCSTHFSGLLVNFSLLLMAWYTVLRDKPVWHAMTQMHMVLSWPRSACIVPSSFLHRDVSRSKLVEPPTHSAHTQGMSSMDSQELSMGFSNCLALDS